MLISKNLEERTYQEMLGEAIMQIPLYSSEWTNYNASDPGITVLENLTAFEALQQNTINRITPAVKQKLLQMAGFSGKKGRCARVLLSAEHKEERIVLPANQKFMLGDLCFETNRRMVLENYRLKKILGKRDGEFYDYTVLTDKEIPMASCVFGDSPKAGDALYFVFNKPVIPGEELLFYVAVSDRHERNSFEEKEKNVFASLRFECYTENGFEQIHVKDNTGCFLISGEIRMRMPEQEMIVCPELMEEGYCIRAVLEYADYDVSPKLMSVHPFLFEAWQKESKSNVFTFQKMSRVPLLGIRTDKKYVQVFCREEKGASYYKYEMRPGAHEKGRFYEWGIETDENGQETEVFLFDKRKTGYGPERTNNAIRIVTYSEEMMRQYALGTVYGYDNQEVELPVKNIVPDSFCIIAQRVMPDGEEVYDFVRPNRYEESDLSYQLLENEGKIVIEDAGEFIGAKLFVASCSVTRGKEGNIREGNQLTAVGFFKGIKFTNPGPGTGGCFRESLQDVRNRFLEDIKKPYIAVTASDYEQIIKETPGLCIRKVKAVTKEHDEVVRIAVMPGTGEEFPRLSASYKKVLRKRIEERRLLTTRVEIADPAYLPVNVKGTLYIKRHYENEAGNIEKSIREKIDYIHSEKNFGEPLKFDEIFRTLEQLDCVEFIYDLSLFPQNQALGRIQENDIIPNDNCLCYAGNISLEIHTYNQQ